MHGGFMTGLVFLVAIQDVIGIFCFCLFVCLFVKNKNKSACIHNVPRISAQLQMQKKRGME